jgi:NTP pyrophosphatase (non-canonical NTP hydrolase)
MAEKETMTFFEFCEKLKEDGAYIGEDWHMYRKDGRPLSRKCRNGYYLLRKMYNHHTYHFMEHRVIWYFCCGEFDLSLTVNHKDFDRTNNNIANLELVTMKENLDYTKEAGRMNVAKGEDSGKALFTNKEVQALRYLHKHGWSKEQLQNLFDIKWSNTLNRILSGARYGSVADAADLISIYPAIVARTWRKDLDKKDRINNAILGLNGELGELTDMFKKGFYHGHDMDMNHIMLEMGDILYYICALANEMGWDFAEMCYENMEKLYNRYPNGFDPAKSLHRKDGDI